MCGWMLGKYDGEKISLSLQPSQLQRTKTPGGYERKNMTEKTEKCLLQGRGA